MRVGLLLDRPVPEVGGGYTYQHEILRAILAGAEESNHHFFLLCEQADFKSLTQLVRGTKKVELAPLPRPFLPRAVRTAVRSIGRTFGWPTSVLPREARVVARDRLDMLWTISPYPHEALDVPLITPVFDLQHRIRPWFPETSRGRLWQSRERYYGHYLRRSAYVIVGTQEGQREVERFYQVPADRIRVVPLPTPGFALRAEGARGEHEVDRRLEALGLQRGYLFYPAQLWPHKNHANLLLALRSLHEKHEFKYRLVLAGSDQGNGSYVRRMIEELNLEPYVTILGFVSQEDLVALYAGADALVFVSFFGPDNLPPLEAFALECPVVASDIPGMAEQLGDAALLVRPDSPDDIADAIARLHEDPQLAITLCERGLRRARSWTSADYVRSVFSLLDQFEPIRRCWTR